MQERWQNRKWLKDVSFWMTKWETSYTNSRKNYSIKCATCNSIFREISVFDECIGTQDQNQTSKHCIARLSSTGWNTRSRSCKISRGHIYMSQLHFHTKKHLETRRNKIEKLIQNSNSSLFKIQTKISNSTQQSHHTFKHGLCEWSHYINTLDLDWCHGKMCYELYCCITELYLSQSLPEA